MIKIVRRERTFKHPFPHGVTMDLSRLEPWEIEGVKAAAARAAAQVREGGAAILRYGFESEEFSVLADPAKWEGVAEFIYAVELGKAAIVTWTGIEPVGSGNAAVSEASISWLLRHAAIRAEFLRVMDDEGALYVAEVVEGNG